MISAIVSGRLGQDAELRDAGQSKVLSISVASDEYDFKAKAKVATWVRVSMFGKRAESLAEHLTKGTSVVVRGSLSIREYQKKDGSAGYSVEVRADDIELFGGKGGEKSGGGSSRRESKPSEESGNDFNDDKIPF